jgi:2-octaprenyl-6-methoxyphenol hydroxylase
MSATVERYDVLIAGGGMVGASLALALSSSAWRIALVDPSGLSTDNSPSFDERATALSWSSRSFLGALGLWQTLEPGVCPIRHIHVSEQGRFGRSRLHAEELGVDALGHVLPNRLLGDALSQRLSACSNVRVEETGISTILPSTGSDTVTVRDEEGRLLETRLLVVADGARSRLRDALGIASHTVRFPHSALVANLEVQKAHGHWAYERFTPAGPMALLPLLSPDGGCHRMNMVLSLPQDSVDDYRNRDAAELLKALRRRFGAHLGDFTAIGERAIYPLFQVRARELIAERTVLAGNAAMAVHPVAGQGFNLALRGVADLADRLLHVAELGGDPGHVEPLQAHARHQQRDMAWTGGWTRGLVEGFTLGLPGLGAARGAALMGLDRAGLLRRWFARQAMGRIAGLSPLSRGIGPVRED